MPSIANGTSRLQIHQLSKSYAAPVLRDVTLTLAAGEVHALVGANGAGKSTLARIVAGITKPDGGDLSLDAHPYAPRGRGDAESRGVFIVMQELNQIGTLSVAENLFFNRLPRRWGFMRRRNLLDQAREALRTVGLDSLNPWTPMERLGVGQRQLIEIAAALSRECKWLILDEPTAALTDPEIHHLFEHIQRLKREGVGMIYISHRMDEIRQIADRITVLRDGEVAGRFESGRVASDELIRVMVGREAIDTTPSRRSVRGSVALRVEGLCAGKRVQNVSFQSHYGEILGLSGLVGSGRSETMRAVFGADGVEKGAVYREDRPQPVRIRRPADAVRAGIGMIPEDRRQDGLLLPQSIRINSTLARLEEIAWGNVWLHKKRERDWVETWREQLDIRCESTLQLVGRLSGGNQQKVLIARWLMRDCPVLIFDEPTRGIDVGAKAAIYRLLHELTAQGRSVIMVSSDLEELQAVCDRILVMSAGRVAGEFSRGHWSRDALMDAAFSGYMERRTGG